MKKVSITLSALAVAATVSTAMAHTKSGLAFYCIAVQTGTTLTLPYAAGTETQAPCTVVTKARTLQGGEAYNQYGYIKTTPPNQPCQITNICPRLVVTGE